MAERGEYMINYEKENLKQVRLRLSKKTEPELIEFIDTILNKQGYIKALIRADMESDAPLYKQFQ